MAAAGWARPSDTEKHGNRAMSVIVNHDESFATVTQAAIRRAFLAALEAPVVPGEPGPARSQRLFELYRNALGTTPADPSEARTARTISNDLADLTTEYFFFGPDRPASFVQYFDFQDGMVYEIKQQAD